MKCPFGNHYHYTRRSYRLCFHRGLDRDVALLVLSMVDMGLEMALKHEESKRHCRALRAKRKKREEIMEKDKMYKLRIDGVGHTYSGAFIIFRASDGEVLKFLQDLEQLVLGIGEVKS